MDRAGTEEWPSVEYPVVLLDGGDVSLYEHAGSIAGDLEPWAANEDGFEFFDARGRRLRPFAALYGVDVMVDPDDLHDYSHHVLEVLHSYLGKAQTHADHRPLKRFVQILEEYMARR